MPTFYDCFGPFWPLLAAAELYGGIVILRIIGDSHPILRRWRKRDMAFSRLSRESRE